MSVNQNINVCLSESSIYEALTPGAGDVIDDLLVLETVDSTNDQVMERLSDAKDGYHICVANQQTRGKGRDGRSWVSPADSNIYLTVGYFVRDLRFAQRMSCLSLAIAVAVARLMSSLGVAAKIKWPNDVLVENQKLAGILVESKVSAQGVRIVIGVGLNVNMPDDAAEAIDQPWIDMRSLKKDGVDRNVIAAGLISAIMDSIQMYISDGFSSFESDWVKFDLLAENSVELIEHEELISATVLGVAEDCGLRLKVAENERVVYAGDVKLKLGEKC